MVTAAVLAIAISHIWASRPFWASLKRGQMPSSVAFAMLSFLLYYDLGLLTEALFGYSIDSPFFESFLSAKDSVFLIGFFILLVAPWCLRVGYRLVGRPTVQEPPRSFLASGRAKWFYLVCLCILLPLLVVSARYLSAPIWGARVQVGQDLGALIVVLYLPLYLLAFYVVQDDAQGAKGTLFALLLAVATMFITWPIGQRTTILLPLLMIMLFRGTSNVTKLVAVCGTLVVFAGLLLPAFKWQYADSTLGPGRLIVDTLQSDFARAPVLETVIRMSEPVGTKVLPYSGAGYVYSALFSVPRAIVPFKGDSTARFFTAAVVGTSVDDTNWGFGVGMVEELLLNFGFLLLIPGLVLYGSFMGLCDKLSDRVQSLRVPSRLAALWICGYHLPAIILLFGLMALVGYGLHRWFVAPRRQHDADLSKGRQLCSAP